MKFSFTLLFFCLFCYFTSHGQGPNLGDGQYHLLETTVDGMTRSYTLYEPEGHDGTEEWPLVFVLHGFSTPVDTQIEISQMYLVADTAKFLIAYPQGMAVEDIIVNDVGIGWSVPGVNIAEHDDVAFISQIIDDIGANPDFAIDLSRVYATGWSNGGEMSFYLACALSDKIAAVAGIAAQMNKPLLENYCMPVRKISVLHMLGTEDIFFPVEENDVFPAFSGTAEYWAANNNCNTGSVVINFEDIDQADMSTVTLSTYPDCDEAFEVLSYHIEGGGHAWPGGWLPPDWQGFLGNINNDINASSEIWNFFNRNPHPNPPGRVLQENFIHDDSLRSYLLYVPAAYDGSEDWPLVINYHQFGWSPSDYMAHTGMNAVADTGHFLVAYPQGLSIVHPISMQQGPGWNESENLSVNDDVGFTDALISHISASHQVGPARVYATGWGMGAGMANKAQCDLAGIIAASASVSGTFTDLLIQTCTPERPVSVLVMQGTADPFLAYDPDPNHPIMTLGIPGTLDYLLTNNACVADSTVTEVADADPADGSTVTIIEYGDCADGTEVALYRINGGGHAWPGGGPLPEEFFGPVNRDINASSEIWNFFNRNTLTSAREYLKPSEIDLRAYPNPASTQLTFEFELTEAAPVNITLYNPLGQLVQELTDENLPAGRQRVSWQRPASAPAGLYYYRLQIGGRFVARPVVLR